VLEDLVNGKHEEENSRSLMKSDKSTIGQTIFVPTKWAADCFCSKNPSLVGNFEEEEQDIK